ncbi:alpha/beta hydrolase [Streptomyces triticagri]|uniref:Alpha/beta hydrolase n=1 Tax=Streptomyces triticagri TaxID=2293568 RepID=A0A372MBV5_9ACTN|nr:alpha/beta hydrolase [Streptomyces triticagri]RFU88422.1 alpha/beta hydrolase [Streptomyces triticagri]
MSRPSTFVPPVCARAGVLGTDRGEFAVLDAWPGEGPGRGTALLLPGYTGSKEDFVALLEPISAAGYRCVAVDGRGQYETPGPDDPEAYAQQELALDVLAQAAAAGASGRVHLLGHSLGGQIARAAVLLDARPFRSLTLMSSGPARISPSQRSRVELLSGALQTMEMAEVWAAIQALEPPEETDTDHNAPDLRARWLRHNPAQLIATGAQLAGEPDRVDELARVPLPMHVLSGDHDETWPVPLIDEMAVRLGAHRTVVAGADHSPNTDRPGPTASALVEFWTGADTRASR